MKRRSIFLLLSFIGLFCVKEISATTFTSVKDGNWSDPSTWDQNAIPQYNDEVIISGHKILVNNTTVVDMSGSAILIDDLTIRGSLNSGGILGKLSITGGASVEVLGDVLLEVTDNSKSVGLEISNVGTELSILGDLIYQISASAKASVNLSSASAISLGGNVSRPNEYGSFTMEDGTSITFNGSGIQSIPTANISGDTFNLANVVIDNTNGIMLSRPLEVEGDLKLTKGNIISSASNPVIIGDMGTITGGSKDAYIEGPVQKMGRTASSGFVFPIGNATTFAPMRISEVSNTASNYTATYKGDPPPFGVFENSIQTVDTSQYWELIKTAGSDDVAISLTWEDGARSTLTSLDSVVVVGLENEGTPSATWNNYGQQSAIGGVGSGESGTVSSLDGDPPPFGVFKLTVGSGSPTSSLPVELINFEVKKESGKTNIYWKSGSEINSAQYEIERSEDGVNYGMIGITKIDGNSVTIREYDFTDNAPVPGANYYRLKIVDLDGSFEYSKIATISFSEEPILMVAPNPVVDVLVINTGAENGYEDAAIEIFNQAGSLLSATKLNLIDGKAEVNISAFNVTTPGVYYLRVSGTASSQIVKFMKID